MKNNEYCLNHQDHEIAELIDVNFIEFEEIELLELLLGLFMTQEDGQRLSRICYGCFGSFTGLVNSSPKALQQAGLPIQIILTIKLIQAFNQRVVNTEPEINAWYHGWGVRGRDIRYGYE